jgi:prevent-host-death family protein
MGTTWQVQEAKNHFSELIEKARSEGPQVVTRHGRPVARVVAIEEATAPPADDGFLEFLLSAPKVELELAPRRGRKAAPLLGR